MLIRTQNKQKIFNLNKLVLFYTEKEGDTIKIELQTENIIGTLGKYSSEKKVIKVLDIIQDTYVEGKEKVFEMPADDEVIV